MASLSSVTDGGAVELGAMQSTAASSGIPHGGAISRKEFEAERFDAKGWINAQLHSGSSHEPHSAAVQTLVMKLQLMSADAQSSLAQSSSELFTALPKSVE